MIVSGCISLGWWESVLVVGGGVGGEEGTSLLKVNHGNVKEGGNKKLKCVL